MQKIILLEVNTEMANREAAEYIKQALERHKLLTRNRRRFDVAQVHAQKIQGEKKAKN